MNLAIKNILNYINNGDISALFAPGKAGNYWYRSFTWYLQPNQQHVKLMKENIQNSMLN